MKTILLAEDNDLSLALYEAMFDDSSWRVVVAKKGPEAVELANQERPDVVLLDIQLPVMDGIEVCRRLKTNPETASIPVIVISGLPNSANRLAAADAGADEFVAKPFSTALLMEIVERLAGATPG